MCVVFCFFGVASVSSADFDSDWQSHWLPAPLIWAAHRKRCDIPLLSHHFLQNNKPFSHVSSALLLGHQHFCCTACVHVTTTSWRSNVHLTFGHNAVAGSRDSPWAGLACERRHFVFVSYHDLEVKSVSVVFRRRKGTACNGDLGPC